jgi:hypothetical protein
MRKADPVLEPVARPAVCGSQSTALATAGLMLACLLLTRHTQIDGLTRLVAPFALLLAVIWSTWSWKLALLLPATAYCLLSFLASTLIGIEPEDSFRFILVTLGTLLAACAGRHKVHLPFVLAPLVIQAVIVIAISVYLSVIQDESTAVAVRSLALENDWGDVYSLDGIYYRVQLIGNALLPVLFMISAAKHRDAKIYRIYLAISACAILAAGNLTYILVCVVYVSGMLFKARERFSGQRLLLGVFVIGFIATYGASSLVESVQAKSEYSDSSIGVRLDQVDTVIEAFSRNPTAMLVGFGLGARLPDGKIRNYSEGVYIEVQALYFFYQLGFFGFSIYLLTLIVAVRSSLSAAGIIIFGMYILSGLSNPYILDSNQIIVTLILASAFRRPYECKHQ